MSILPHWKNKMYVLREFKQIPIYKLRFSMKVFCTMVTDLLFALRRSKPEQNFTINDCCMVLEYLSKAFPCFTKAPDERLRLWHFYSESVFSGKFIELADRYFK